MIVSLLGLVISLFAYLVAFPNPSQRRFDIYGSLLALHIGATLGYWLLSFESGMDAFLYYRDPMGYYNKDPLESGTYFIVHLVQMIRQYLGGSFLDHFLFFQCFGMMCVALLIRCFHEVAESLGLTVPLHVYALVFLPGLHFWTAGIGKDGPMIFAVSLSLWAALRIQKRGVYMVIAIVIMALIRPHIAAVAMTGVATALFFSEQVGKAARIALTPVAAIGLAYIVARASERFGVTLDAQSVSDFIETEQSHGERFGSGADLQSQPLPMKMFALLFRPFFFDAQGVMGLVASTENAVLLYIFGYVTYHWRLIVQFAKKVDYVLYALILAGTLIFLQSLVNYNIGLGQRQKMMEIPAVLLLYATVYLYKQYLAGASAALRQGFPHAEQTNDASPAPALSRAG